MQTRLDFLQYGSKWLGKGEYKGRLCTVIQKRLNSVRNEKCSRPGSAKRAEDILIHMESRYKRKATDVAPDEASYANVIHGKTRYRTMCAIYLRFTDDLIQLGQEVESRI